MNLQSITTAVFTVKESHFETPNGYSHHPKVSSIGYYPHDTQVSPVGYYPRHPKVSPVSYYPRHPKVSPVSYYPRHPKVSSIGYYPRHPKVSPIGYYPRDAQVSPIGYPHCSRMSPSKNKVDAECSKSINKIKQVKQFEVVIITLLLPYHDFNFGPLGNRFPPM